MLLWKWRVRRALKPLREEIRGNEQAVALGSEEWRRWWSDIGQRELRCILMTAWDPVGVGDAPEAWDEYDDYADGVAHRLRDASDPDVAAERVADYLDHIERDFMENLTPQRHQANVYLADTLVAWHEWSFTRGGHPPREWIDED